MIIMSRVAEPGIKKVRLTLEIFFLNFKKKSLNLIFLFLNFKESLADKPLKDIQSKTNYTLHRCKDFAKTL